ncbi:2-octaprenyl-3-methyl-6-methoxy-1,4-benzoquinol hydroxylase [Stenotrophomonas ginsengisoli]|uniref:2-octaprenyl-3-methyl-6-methoxy-1,4-benzoquinol hydroxylase n=1 Tax=Stenotrophomonas ginsengisoli TaxID=336566 RepID=A0A0R0DIW0_9GAMM|nr:UbiH/UbiF family hydroxylase [Stenotrophomonas ginsengisoli]KRG78046.1 2-octaprenyl-3-methyl-6-methoxy-1,4-benzoquinol hydroxylase [Stenotrophomonas ginsengisoli]
MSRQQRLDAIVVGGGVVGAAAALSLAQAGLEVVLVEGREPPAWQADRPDLRVYAFAPDNAALFKALGVWEPVCRGRAPAYRRMRVWDAAGGEELLFDADRLGRAQLGWIIENGLLVDRLWAGLPLSGVRVECPATVEQLEQDADGVRVRLSDGRRLEAAMVIAADGADSAVRNMAGIGVDRHDYGQRGLVAYIDSELPNEATAWQRFLPTGPLAVLPAGSRRSSIVWTLPDEQAAAMLALDEAAFNRALTNTFGGRLGALSLASKRVAFPLRRQLAQRYVDGRVLLIGDAAHAVHPLAGQGVNLGLRDVAALRASVLDAKAKRRDWASPARLQRWANARQSEATVAAKSFSAINTLFSNDELHLSLARGPAMGLAGKLPPLVSLFWKHASGG